MSKTNDRKSLMIVKYDGIEWNVLRQYFGYYSLIVTINGLATTYHNITIDECFENIECIL